MELKTIKMSDIVPDENNPREDFGDLRALAQTFEGNTYAPRQPYNPIVVVEDGDLYRIADGERRFRAMAMNGVDECYANVCGSYEEADSMIAMLASDAKEPLKDDERSKAVQRALLLGVPATTVEKTARLKRGQAKKLQSILKRGHFKETIQSSLDQILESEELRDLGATEDEIEHVIESDEATWQSVSSNIRRRIKTDEARSEYVEVLQAFGLELQDEHPDNLSYARMFSDSNTLKDYVSEHDISEDAYFWFNASMSGVYLFVDEVVDDGVDPAVKEREDQAELAIEMGIESRAAWYASAIKMDSKGRRTQLTPNVDGLLLKRAADSREVACFRKNARSGDPGKSEGILYGVCAEVFYQWYSTELTTSDSDIYDPNVFVEPDDKYWKAKVEWLLAFVDDGFQLSETEQEMLEIAQAFLSPVDRDSPAENLVIQDKSAVDPEEDDVEELKDVEVSDVLTEAEMLLNDDSIQIYESTPLEAQETSQAVDSELDVANLVFDGKAVV